MKKKYKLKNCYGDEFELTINNKDVKYIFRQVLSSDEIYIVVYKDNRVEYYDSDTHGRHIDYFEEMEMIFPEHIDLLTETIQPGYVKNFLLIKKGEK